MAKFFLDKSEITMITGMHLFLWYHLTYGEDIKKKNNLNICPLSFKADRYSKASAALYYERDNATNIKWPKIFLDRMWWEITDWLMIFDIWPVKMSFYPFIGCIDLMESDLYVLVTH